MTPEQQLFERAARRFEPPGPDEAWDHLVDKRKRRRRNEQLGAAIVALLITLGAVAGLVRLFGHGVEHRPATPTINHSSVSGLGLIGTGSFDGIARSVAVSDGVVLVQSKGDPALTAFRGDCAVSGTTCAPLWSARVGPDPVIPEFTTWAADGVAYVGSDHLYAFSTTCATDGSVCRPLWEGQVEGRPYEPAVADGAVYVTTSTGRVYRYSTSCAPNADGVCRPDWVSRRSRTLLFHPQVIGSHVVVQRFRPASYLAYPTTCSRTCRVDGTWDALPGTEHPAIPSEGGGRIFIGATAADGSGTVSVYPSDCTGARAACEPIWAARLSGEVNAPPPFAADGKVFVGSTVAGFLFAFDQECSASTCEPLWMASVPGITFTHPAVVGGVVFAGSRDGGLYAFDTDCRTDGGPCRPAWTWGTGSSGPGIEAVAATDRRVYAITQTGRLLMFGLRPDGEVRRAGWGGVPLVPGVAALLALVAIVLIRRRAQAA